MMDQTQHFHTYNIILPYYEKFDGIVTGFKGNLYSLSRGSVRVKGIAYSPSYIVHHLDGS